MGFERQPAALCIRKQTAELLKIKRKEANQADWKPRGEEARINAYQHQTWRRWSVTEKSTSIPNIPTPGLWSKHVNSRAERTSGRAWALPNALRITRLGDSPGSANTAPDEALVCVSVSVDQVNVGQGGEVSTVGLVWVYAGETFLLWLYAFLCLMLNTFTHSHRQTDALETRWK